MKKEPSCIKCKHLAIYRSENNDEILICEGEPPEECDEPGVYLLREISDFDESLCLLFKQK